MINNKADLMQLFETQRILLCGDKGRVRLHVEDKDEKRDRNPFERDYSRIMYSNSFRRLQGKMQLMPVEPHKFNRNRLTHSLEVSQIARSIAGEINRASLEECEAVYGTRSVYSTDEIYVVEAGAFAHDIGNPPFGHKGEKVLNKLMKGYGGYEGNAQSLRILMNVEKKFPGFKGLNLTIRTLTSIMKYNVVGNESAEKFVYRNEYNEIIGKLEDLGLSGIFRTLDTQIIDAADEIAYCAHDLEDALAQKYFTIDEFVYELEHYLEIHEKETLTGENVNLFKDWVKRARTYAEGANVYGSSEEYAFVFRKELTSILVNELIRDLDIFPVDDLGKNYRLKTGTSQEFELAFKNRDLVSAIKICTFDCINRTNHIQIYERLGSTVITGLFEAMIDEKFNKNMLLMPAEYRKTNYDNASRYRKVADYIGGMMDTYAIDTYKKIYGDHEIQRLYKRVWE